ncbi:MAG: peptide deformylase [Candidatus Sungiibacteriota bacterium]|uniref:Peptide deformylase n=1 Tax=Candidatus Sungiibacteriota bacterium TaxID=2750080 RepID=A0A7T5UQM3_9BACT|nr:MAG: peptide deformylase [Candidatus Sungbacteria bacterium]
MEKTTPIVKEPSRVLRRKATEIPVGGIPTSRVQRLISQMKEALKNTPDGVGLAAPQVGESLRIFIVSGEAEEIDKAEKKGWQRSKADSVSQKSEPPYEKRDWKYYVFINPAVKKASSTKIEGPEGCLSVPGKYGAVQRHEKITVEAYDEQGKKITRGASRFFARVMQHELDHLEGILFIDKAENITDANRYGTKKH